VAVRLATPPSGTLAPSRDRRLQTARRLDWRFLLPEPQLGRVAYLGPSDDRLLDALRECSASVVVARTDGTGRHAGLRDASFDVAVVQSPRPDALARAAALLRHGGSLYCELARPLPWRRAAVAPRRGARDAGALLALPQARACLRELGFGDVEAHWHYPDFERCGGIVPVGHRTTAGAFFLARAGGRLVAPLLARAGGWLLGADHVAGLLPCVSLVARKGGAP